MRSRRPPEFNVFEFTDYRSLLDGWLHHSPTRSVRGLAKRLAVSPSSVAAVRNGKRKLRVEHAPHWAWGMRLQGEDAWFWSALVRVEHAATRQLRQQAEIEVAGARGWRAASRDALAARVISEWYIAAVLELARCAGFRDDPAWIADHMRPQIRVEQAADALHVLRQTGLLVTAADGTLKVDDRHLAAESQETLSFIDHALQRNHRISLDNAISCLSEIGHERRHISSILVAVDEARLPEVVATVQRIQVEAATVAADHTPTTVYQILLCAVPRSTRVTPDQ